MLVYFLIAIIIFIVLCSIIYFYIKKRYIHNVICKEINKNTIDLDRKENNYINTNSKENKSLKIINLDSNRNQSIRLNLDNNTDKIEPQNQFNFKSCF